MISTTGSRLKIEQIDVGKLIPWDNNPRKNEQAVNPVAKSIRQFGFNVPILCNKEFRIIAGHTRWKAAKKLGMRKVPVVQLDLSGKDETAFAIAENKTGELADWDTPKLKAILDDLNSEDLDLNGLGFSQVQLDALLVSPRYETPTGLTESISCPFEENGSVRRTRSGFGMSPKSMPIPSFVACLTVLIVDSAW